MNKFQLKDNDILIGICHSAESQINRLELVTNIYLKQGYFQDIPSIAIDGNAEELIDHRGFTFIKNKLSVSQFELFLKTGLLFRTSCQKHLYLDKYFWQSINFFARSKEGCAGSLRLIMSKPICDDALFTLPTKSNMELQVFSEWLQRISEVNVELSQFAKEKAAPTATVVALLRAAAQFSLSNSIFDWIATTDNRVLRLLNGYYFNFQLPAIGPSTYYLGSESTPILINIENSLQCAASKESSKEIARYIRGENLPTYNNCFFSIQDLS